MKLDVTAIRGPGLGRPLVATSRLRPGLAPFRNVVTRRQVSWQVRFKPKEGEGKENGNVSKTNVEPKKAIESVTSKFSDAASKLAETINPGESSPANNDSTSLGYSGLGAITLGIAVWMMARPAQFMNTMFTGPFSLFTTVQTAMMASGGVVPWLVQMGGSTQLPIGMGAIALAMAARSKNLGADSSMRLNFGLMVYSAARIATAVFMVLSLKVTAGEEILKCVGIPAAGILLTSAIAIKGIMDAESKDSNLLNTVWRTVKGMGAGTKRIFTYVTWEGAFYGLMSLCAMGCAIFWGIIGQPWTMLNMMSAEAALGVEALNVRNTLATYMSRVVAANFLFASTSFLALKELADKKGLASATARLLNISFVVSLSSIAILANWAVQTGVSAEGSIWASEAPVKITAIMMALCALFAASIAEKGGIEVDTAATAS